MVLMENRLKITPAVYYELKQHAFIYVMEYRWTKEEI